MFEKLNNKPDRPRIANLEAAVLVVLVLVVVFIDVRKRIVWLLRLRSGGRNHLVDFVNIIKVLYLEYIEFFYSKDV